MKTVSITVIFKKGVCPLCDSPVEKIPETENKYPEDRKYNQYLVNAADIFRDTSLPLCLHCWLNNVLECEKCYMPKEMCTPDDEKDRYNDVGAFILRQTTLVTNGSNYYCEQCFQHEV